jgi:hypothetical protein
MTEGTRNRSGETIELNYASRKLPVATDGLGSIFAGCRQSRVRRAEWRIQRSESVADRPRLDRDDTGIRALNPPFVGSGE